MAIILKLMSAYGGKMAVDYSEESVHHINGQVARCCGSYDIIFEALADE